MLLRHILTLAVAATLSTCQKFKKSDEALSVRFSEDQERSKEALDIRDHVHGSTVGGTIIGKATATLQTYGLSTCVGMVAVGGAGPTGYNKVLAHVTCKNAVSDMNEWADKVSEYGLTDLHLAVSIVNPDLVPEALRDAQKVLNRMTLQTALLLVLHEGWRVKPYVRQSLEGPEPLGTMFVSEDNGVQAEGNPVGWPSPPTLDVDCFWPVLYQPSDANDEVIAAARREADGICKGAGGCLSGTPQCAIANGYPLGRCFCV